MRSLLFHACSLSVLVWAVAGCHSMRKPLPIAALTQRPVAATAPANIDIRPYLAASLAGECVYRRRELLERTDRPEVEYTRRTSSNRLFEGDTNWHVFHAIERNLPADAGYDGQDPIAYSETNGSALAFRFALDEPIALIPADLKPSEPSIATTRLQYLGVDRAYKAQGQITRTAAIEGYEDVEVPAGRFPHCLRIRVAFTLDLRWGPTIDWLMYVWLSPEAGDVKRMQRLSGWFLIFHFGSSFEYELVSYKPTAATQPVGSTAPLWKDGLLAFDRGLPDPRIGALLVNFH